jgi:hypothetical protein
MAKVRFYCDSGANHRSCRDEVLDTVKDLGLDDGEWEEMQEDDRENLAEEWAKERLEIGYESIE